MFLADTANLVNLVSDTRTVPECISEACTAEGLSANLQSVIDAPDAQRAVMAITMERLGAGGEEPGLRAAKAVLNGLAA